MRYYAVLAVPVLQTGVCHSTHQSAERLRRGGDEKKKGLCRITLPWTLLENEIADTARPTSMVELLIILTLRGRWAHSIRVADQATAGRSRGDGGGGGG